MEFNDDFARKIILEALGELPRKGVDDLGGFKAVIGSLIEGAGNAFHEIEKMPELMNIPSQILDKLELLGTYLDYLKKFVKERRI